MIAIDASVNINQSSLIWRSIVLWSCRRLPLISRVSKVNWTKFQEFSFKSSTRSLNHDSCLLCFRVRSRAKTFFAHIFRWKWLLVKWRRGDGEPVPPRHMSFKFEKLRRKFLERAFLAIITSLCSVPVTRLVYLNILRKSLRRHKRRKVNFSSLAFVHSLRAS